jgi:quinolinate synthase
MSQLEFSREVEERTLPIYSKLKTVIPAIEWPVFAPYIDRINQLKKERNAVILAHNYQTPEIYHGVADYTGDSLGLSQMAAKTDADIIVFCGVHFMAETAKILSMDKMVLIPDSSAGCSLASSITAEDVLTLKAQHPNAPVVTYVNVSAAVKAVSDICCTSSNALKVVESLSEQKIIFIPDNYLGQYVASQTTKELILWHGKCEVHEKFTGQELRDYRSGFDSIKIIAHPECPPDVLSEADYVGSTKGMIDYVAKEQPKDVVMITECSMSDNVAVEFPMVNFVKPCNLCPHMKKITLPKILRSLELLEDQVFVDTKTANAALQSVTRMLEIY